ncbi:hypothetical protein HMPREF1992_00482 [Selenomonas sp. oral taxon 892 str. F0426]|nr:hypothetical protein HMPREF1992_00482 [Selenomonas sp. oral taxon 892 str. F0426]
MLPLIGPLPQTSHTLAIATPPRRVLHSSYAQYRDIILRFYTLGKTSKNFFHQICAAISS